MNRRTLAIGGIATAAVAAGVLMRLRMDPTTGDGGPDALWARKFLQPDGRELAMSALRGRPLVLNFWATWCPPCVEEMPEIDRFHREFSPKGWQVLGLAIDRAEPVRDFLSRHPVSYLVAVVGLEGTELSRELGNTTGALPFTVLFDRRGRPTRRKLGRTSFDELASWTSGV